MRNAIRLLLFLIVFLASAACVPAADIYFASSPVGGGTGANCANAKGLSSLSGADWAASNTLHVCGTIGAAVTAQGSGSLGNVITLRFETGAKISMAVCPATGCLNLSSRSYITVDGGVPCGPAVTNKATCNGIIEATANGTGLANQTASSVGINIAGATNLEIKNIIVQNLYRHTSTSDVALSSGPLPSCVYNNSTGSNIDIHDATMHDALWCLAFVSGGVYSAVKLHSIETYNTGHAFAIGVVDQTSTDIKIYDNYDHDHANWTSTNCIYHNDGIHTYRTGTGNVTAAIYYNNRYGGDWGTCSTAVIYTEGLNMDITLFNNVILGNQLSSGIGNGCWNLTVGASGTGRAYNNTCNLPAAVQGSFYDVKWEGDSDIRNNVSGSTTQVMMNLPSAMTVPAGKLIDYNAWIATSTSCQWFSNASAINTCNGGTGYMNLALWRSWLLGAFPASGGD